MFTGILLWLFYHHGTAAWHFWLELITWQCWSSSLPLSFCPLVASFSIFFLVALCFNQLCVPLTLENNRSPSLSFGVRGFGLCRRHCFSLSPFQAVRNPRSSCLLLSCLCCDPSVGGRASRKHRGANEALGMPAGGEEPGAATGESLRRRCARRRYPGSHSFMSTTA